MRIAVFTKNRVNPAYGAARLGAERAAARLGATVAHYVPETPDDADEQSALVARALADGADAVAMAAVHPTRVNAAVRAINAAGVPLVGFVSRSTEGAWDCFVGADDAALGEAIADYLFARLPADGTVVVIEAGPDSTTSLDRARGFAAAAARHPQLRIVGRCYGRYEYQAARAAMAALLPSMPRIDGVLAANDVMALGALDALAQAGRRARVVGVNAIPDAVAAIRRGTLLASADFSAMNLGAVAAECAVRRARGEALPQEILLPVAIVDAANAAQWDRPYEERPCIDWSAALAGARPAH